MRVPPGSQLVFDQIVTSATNGGFSTTDVYSDPKFNEWLGKANDLRFFSIVDRATGDGLLIGRIWEAGDEELAWFPTYGSEGVVLQGNVSSNGTEVIAGADTDTLRGRPSLAFRRLGIVIGAGASTFSARVRIWASGRNGYRRFNRLLMAERVEGTNIVYAAQEACAWLVGPDQLAVGFFTDEVPGSDTTLAIVTGESPNGRTWFTGVSAAGPIYPGWFQVIGTTDTYPIGGFLRFGVQLGGTIPSATVRLWVTGRDVRSG